MFVTLITILLGMIRIYSEIQKNKHITKLTVFYLFDFLKIFFLFILERGEEKEKERERNINVWLPLMRTLLETWPATQECALTGN